MYIYLLLLVLILLIFFFNKNKKKALIYSFILISLVAILRKYTVGVDTPQFSDAFSRIASDSTWNYLNFRYELGFYYLCKIISIFSKEPQWLIVVSSAFINYSVYRFINKNSSNYLLSTLLYILMNCFFSNMNLMRQAISLEILLFGFEQLKEKKYIKYIIFVLISSLFHTVSFASILLLAFSILPNRKMTYYFEILLAIVTFLFYKQFFNILSLGFGYSEYAQSIFGTSNYFGSLICALEIFLIIVFLNVLTKSNRIKKENNNTIKCLNIAVILFIWFSFLTIRMTIFNRISGLFMVYSIVLIPSMLDNIKSINNNNYKIAKGVVLTMYLLSFMIISIYRPEWYGVIPYSFFWN